MLIYDEHTISHYHIKDTMKPNICLNTQLMPTIIQDVSSNKVYMLGYMNQKSFEKTIETGYVHFWSRSKKRLWMKGEESRNRLKVQSIRVDCDGDALLVSVILEGTAVCHTGNTSCFFQDAVCISSNEN